MVDFKKDVLDTQKVFDEYIKSVGGLPEIAQAATDLQAAIEQTAEEIGGAVFASRFSRVVYDNFWAMNAGSVFTLDTRQAIEEEGEAGLKRAQLRAELGFVENELHRLIGHLVGIRADLKISQQEY